MSEGQGHILVVDDNRMNRIKLATSLEQQGHAVAWPKMASRRWRCWRERYRYDACCSTSSCPGWTASRCWSESRATPTCAISRSS